MNSAEEGGGAGGKYGIELLLVHQHIPGRLGQKRCSPAQQWRRWRQRGIQSACECLWLPLLRPRTQSPSSLHHRPHPPQRMTYTHATGWSVRTRGQEIQRHTCRRTDKETERQGRRTRAHRHAHVHGHAIAFGLQRTQALKRICERKTFARGRHGQGSEQPASYRKTVSDQERLPCEQCIRTIETQVLLKRHRESEFVCLCE